VRIALFTCDEPELEAFGIRLLNQVAAVFLDEMEPPELLIAPIGPDFHYDSYPPLFLSRRGRGPLHVVWDTNLLIDFFEHGHALWEVGLPEGLPDYADELEALQFIIAVWVIRDIRFHVLPRVLIDAKRKLSQRRLAERAHALDQFAAALRLVGNDDPDGSGSGHQQIRFGHELTRVLDRVPGSDQPLIRDAVHLGAHVFLTRDKGLLKCRPDLLPFGLLLASPGDLLEHLAACGALHCFCGRHYAYWPLPDQARVTHLVKVLRQLPDSGPSSAQGEASAA
jgi:hypothetical protein